MMRVIAILLLLCLFAPVVFAEPVVPNSAPGQKTSKYGYGEGDTPDVWFFPQDKSRWDGYKVTNWDWMALTDEQREMFIVEGADELARKKNVSVNIDSKWRLRNYVNKTAGTATDNLPAAKRPMIEILFESLKENNYIKSSPVPDAKIDAALSFLRGQIRALGLVDSYAEDDMDYSYTYDDALCAMAFLSAGDTASAKKILDAFLAIGPEPQGGFLHRYNSKTGRAEGALSVGHNAYLLQAMNMYYLKTKDAKYNQLGRAIADFMLSQQAADGGIYGYPGVTWKSTENNLAALTAINNLGVSQDMPYYIEKARAIRDFLITKCWNGTRFLCGENDARIITDVQALGAMVLGPSYSGGAYWIKDHTLNTKIYAGNNTVTGFDENTDKDTVWTEGTLQEAMAFMAAGDMDSFSYYKAEAEKLFVPASGAFLSASNKGTTGFGEYFHKWQAVAPAAWYIYAARQDNVLRPLAP